jgi:hypothetical protein
MIFPKTSEKIKNAQNIKPKSILAQLIKQWFQTIRKLRCVSAYESAYCCIKIRN